MVYTDTEIRNALETVPHAGGEAYSESMGKLHPSDADTTVSTRSELVDAVDSSAEIIAVDSDIYMGDVELDIEDKTIVGDRGWNGSDGPLLHTDQRGETANGIEGRPHTMFYSTTTEGEPRLTGLRLRGARWDEDFTRWNYKANLSRGITLKSEGGEVDNCEIFGFTWNDVHILGDYEAGRFTEAEIHHCHLHKSYLLGYGYGVGHWRGIGHIHHNYFNEQRHAIDGYGWPESGYTVEENVFGPTQYSHTVDMHCLTENGASDIEDPEHPEFGLRAGGAMDVRNNTFCFVEDVSGHVQQGVSIRGVPLEYVEIHDNRFSHSQRPPYNSANERKFAWTQQNVYGLDTWDPLVPEGEYTEEWNAHDNQFDAPDAPHDGRGASVDIVNPDDPVDEPDASDASSSYTFPRERLSEIKRVCENGS